MDTLTLPEDSTLYAPHNSTSSENIPFVYPTNKDSVEQINDEDEITMESVPRPGVRIVKDYVRAKRVLSEPTSVRCPITNQEVQADKLNEHLRVVLLDPQWKKQRELIIGRAKIGTDVDVAQQLADFVTKRPELFGKRATETRKPSTHIGPTMPSS